MNDLELNFSEIINMIETRRQNAYKKVNEELISLYWDFGKYISEKVNDSNWGDKIVDKLVEFMKREYPTMRGFNKRGIYRMKQFYETYKDSPFVSPLVTQISWTNNLLILSGTNSIEEKEFYITLSCLVAFELKIGKFKPEYISKMDFYLEALDRQERKENENPSVGVILCASKDEQVVEYAMSRSMSSTMVSQYTLKLIDKKLLEEKLKEINDIVEENNNKK